MRDHGALPEEHWGHTVPLGMHGDGGAFSAQDSLFVIAFNSLVSGGVGEGIVKRFLFTIIRKDDCVKGTLDELLRIFSYSMNYLLTGITPSKDHNDLPVYGGKEWMSNRFRAALVQVRGDWEFYANVL